MALVEGIGHTHRSLEAHMDGVGVAGFGEVLDGKGMVLRSQFQLFTSLSTVDIELVMLWTTDLDLTFEEVAVVDIEREQTDATALLQRRQHLT